MFKRAQIICNTLVEKYKDQFPLLAKEVKEADSVSQSSWYELSDEAYKEFLVWDKMTDDIGLRNKMLYKQKDLLAKLGVMIRKEKNCDNNGKDCLHCNFRIYRPGDSVYSDDIPDCVLEIINEDIEETNKVLSCNSCR